MIVQTADILRVKAYKRVGSSRGEMANVMDCGLEVNEFELHSRYYIHFQTKILGKGTNPLILPALG